MSEAVKEQEAIDTYVAQIERSNLFTIVIEGKDDLLVYREFEAIYDELNCFVSVLPVGGRNTALGIFKKIKKTLPISTVQFLLSIRMNG